MAAAEDSSGHWPRNVGILGLEIYFPRQYVSQEELESADGVSTGKYTIGLEQCKMGFCSDREDIQSICLTVVSTLFRRYGLSPNQVGRLEVGTETILDKSKSVKSVLMQLFAECGNHSVEGLDTTNACYGGTAAVFNSINWMESSSWDGRLAVVVAADIAVYAAGPARPTGGAGAVAMLIGPNAPLVFERGMRGTYMAHSYDFYKPNLSSEYPTVDGAKTLSCYLEALDKSYEDFCKKSKHALGEEFSLDKADFILFHSPFTKMVRKSLGRLLFNDIARFPEMLERQPELQSLVGRTLSDTVGDRTVEQLLVKSTTAMWNEKTELSTLTGRNIGNMYTASLYGCLASLLAQKPAGELKGRRLLMYSYGSGLAASMFSIQCRGAPDAAVTLDALCESLSALPKRLLSRERVTPEQYRAVMDLRQEKHHAAPYEPVTDVATLWPGTYYIESIDDMHRRVYSVHDKSGFKGEQGHVPNNLTVPNGH
ncbi:hydroxymethylglutaryl-CoA synthase 1-like [Sycon ciliatum]|uniref:hydroxymethylglutaryl-CoA synthase 1-like n=1 Tax=Sycon ciliatum TaxID=27933 RepID=UPI0031F674E0